MTGECRKCVVSALEDDKRKMKRVGCAPQGASSVQRPPITADVLCEEFLEVLVWVDELECLRLNAGCVHRSMDR